MKRLVATAPKEVLLEDSLIPSVAKNEVLLKVLACGINRFDALPWFDARHTAEYPVVPGRQIVGMYNGKRYTVWPGTSCGKCADCNKNRRHVCPKLRIVGMHRNGGFAQFVNVPTECLMELPDELSDEHATFIEPVACAFHALEQCGGTEGNQLLIISRTYYALWIAHVAQFLGMQTYVLPQGNSPTSSKLIEKFKIRTGTAIPWNHCDAVIHADPWGKALEDYFSHLHMGSAVCLFSPFTQHFNASQNLLDQIQTRKLNIIGSYGCGYTHMHQAIQFLLAHEKKLNDCVQETFTLEQLQQQWHDLPNILRHEPSVVYPNY